MQAVAGSSGARSRPPAVAVGERVRERGRSGEGVSRSVFDDFDPSSKRRAVGAKLDDFSF
jgi:hypothetical protein